MAVATMIEELLNIKSLEMSRMMNSTNLGGERENEMRKHRRVVAAATMTSEWMPNQVPWQFQ